MSRGNLLPDEVSVRLNNGSFGSKRSSGGSCLAFNGEEVEEDVNNLEE